MSATGMTGAKADRLIYLVGSLRKSKIVALESGKTTNGYATFFWQEPFNCANSAKETSKQCA
jgi:hypothetical protein